MSDSKEKKYDSKKLNDPEFKGELTDEKFKNGPMHDRHCTDCLCCIIFIVFLIGMIAVASYGWNKGDPYKLLAPIDSAGDSCGYTSGYENYPLVYFPNLLNLTQTVCVSSCPSNSSDVDCKPNNVTTSCYASTNATRYNTVQFGGRYCLPDLKVVTNEVLTQYNSVLDAASTDKIGKYMSDVVYSWRVLLIVCFIALAVGFLYMFLLGFFAGVLAWVAIIGTLAALVGGGGYFYHTSLDYTTADSTRKDMQIAAIILWILGGAFFLFICCMYTRIKLAIAIMKAAAGFVKSTPFSLLVPVVFFFLIVAWYAIWICAALYLWSVGDIHKRTDSTIAGVTWDTKTRYAWLYHLFGLLWVNALFNAMSQFILACAVAVWYFSHSGDGTSGKGRIITGLWWSFRYHFGSLAFGSLIVAIIEFIQLMFEWLRKKMQKSGVANNPVMKCLICMVRCLLDCCNRFIKFVNKNAYIQIAITSHNFCTSAKDGFFLVLRNPLRYGAVHAIGGVYAFIGKLLISTATSLIGYIILVNWTKVRQNIYEPIFPTIVFFFVSYMIASIFMSVYGMASSTILQAFLVDEEIAARGGAAKGQHRPPQLEGFIEKHTKDTAV